MSSCYIFSTIAMFGRASQMPKVAFEGQMQILKASDRILNHGPTLPYVIYLCSKVGKPILFLKCNARDRFLFN